MADTLVFYLNEKKVTVRDAAPTEKLSHYIRNIAGLHGTKESCGQGGCGACAVSVTEWIPGRETLRHYAVNACITPLAAVHGKSVYTVEGLGALQTGVHPIQRALAEAHGSQCGYCSPGLVTTMHATCRARPQPQPADIEDLLAANICRCTGYRAILEGFGSLCQNKNKDLAEETTFPEDLKAVVGAPLSYPSGTPAAPLSYPGGTPVGGGPRWERPVTLPALLQLRRRPHTTLTAGYSTLVFCEGAAPLVYVDVTGVGVLHAVNVTDDAVELGGAVTLETFVTTLEQIIHDKPAAETVVMATIVKKLRYQFGSPQVLNVATLGGSLAGASRISDVNLWLTAAGAMATLARWEDGAVQERTVAVADTDLVDGNESPLVAEGEIITTVTLPFMGQHTYLVGVKQTDRAGGGVGLLTAAARLTLHPDTSLLTTARLYCGNYGPRLVRATGAETQLVGRPVSDEVWAGAVPGLLADLCPPATPAYTLQWTRSLLARLLADLTEQRHQGVPLLRTLPPVRATQVYEPVPPDQPPSDSCGRPIIHQSALQQTTGQALYAADTPAAPDELNLALVLSDVAKGTIVSVDVSAAAQCPGFVRYVGHTDVPGSNVAGSGDEELFATKQVEFVGQMVGAVLADTPANAVAAADKIQVTYQPLTPLLTIQEAIEKGSVLWETTAKHGDAEAALAASDHVIEGEVAIGGQKHWYMETQACHVTPREGDEYDVISATQHTAMTQNCVAEALNIPDNRVFLHTKRLGGGFGGKAMESTRIACTTAVASYVTRRPVCCSLPRVTDCKVTGQSAAWRASYKVGVTSEGVIRGLQITVHGNGGAYLFAQDGLAVNFLYSLDNCYRIPNAHAHLVLARTNTAPSGAVRGAGQPDAIFFIEHVLDHVAVQLQVDAEKVRRVNLYLETDTFIWGNVRSEVHVHECWEEVMSRADYSGQRQAVTEFNRVHEHVKRGLAVMGLKQGASCFIHPNCKANDGNMSISPTLKTRFPTKGQALVHVYQDGSVLLQHGGVEMGQGLNTKMIQVASRTLGVPADQIRMREIGTDVMANAPHTGGSSTADYNGEAVLKACQTICEHLQPHKDRNPTGSWKDWVAEAYASATLLSAYGYYVAPVLADQQPVHPEIYQHPHLYYTYGAAVCLVELDTRTGSHTLQRVDIVMDLGRSINPGIDMGQIEGGFIQGYGRMTSEEMTYSPEGAMLGTGPATYRVPSVHCVPREFNVTILKGQSNPRAVYSSKAVGEMPLSLSACAHLALKDAVRAARAATGSATYCRLDAPATVQRLLQACSAE